MRQILFRGKRIENGAWVYGYLYVHEPPLQCLTPTDYIPDASKFYICSTAFADWNMPRQVEFIEVDPDTIGQFTGLTDKNGVKIFEDDVLIFWAGIESGTFVVKFDHCGFYADWVTKYNFMDTYTSMKYLQCSSELEVNGNIHDKNKEN